MLKLFRNSVVAFLTIICMVTPIEPTAGAVPEALGFTRAEAPAAAQLNSIAYAVSQPNITLLTITQTVMRKQPCATCAVVGSLAPGQQISAIGHTSNGAWWTIVRMGVQSYITRESAIIAPQAPISNLHEPRAPVQPSPGTSRSVTVFLKYTVNVSKLNVRSGAGPTFPIVGVLNDGEQVFVEGEEFGWYRIRLNGKLGYVRSQFVTQRISARNDFVEPVQVMPNPCGNPKLPDFAKCQRPPVTIPAPGR